MEGRKVIGIMACDPSGVIGVGGGIPWRFESELKHFLKVVSGGVLIMGRKTFESLPQSLLDKHNCVVFTSTSSKPSSMVSENQASESIKKPWVCVHGKQLAFVSSLKEFEQLEIPNQSKLFMIGGAKIAHLFLKNNLISEFILSIMHKDYTGDTKLDLSLLEGWTKETISTCDDYSVYRRRPRSRSQIQ